MEFILNNIVVYIPIMLFFLYRFIIPRFIYKDLVSGAVIDTKGAVIHLFTEGLVYIIILVISFSSLKNGSWFSISFFVLVSALAVWTIGHGIYFLMFNKQKNHLTKHSS